MFVSCIGVYFLKYFVCSKMVLDFKILPLLRCLLSYFMTNEGIVFFNS